MPLNLAEQNKEYMIQKICGDEEQRHYLESLGFVEDEIDHQEKMQAEILHSFHQALEHQEFQIYFQPKVQPETGSITSAEALVRRIKNGKFLWTPDTYIPLFEQNGFIIDWTIIFTKKPFPGSRNQRYHFQKASVSL